MEQTRQVRDEGHAEGSGPAPAGREGGPLSSEARPSNTPSRFQRQHREASPRTAAADPPADPAQRDGADPNEEAPPEWTDCPVGTFGDKPLVAGQRLGRLHVTPDAATTFARGVRRPAAVVKEGKGWAVYALRVRGRFTQRSTETVPGTGVANVTSVKPVACFVTSDGVQLRAPGPGGHDLSHRQSGPRDDDELPFEDWTEATGPGMAELAGADFLSAFEVAMRDVALFALASSERRVRCTLGQVVRGFGVSGGYAVEDLVRLRLAAARIEAIDDELDELRERWEPHPDLDNAELLFEEGQTDVPALDARVPGLMAERDDVLALAPWLRRLPDPTSILSRSDDEVMAWLGGDCAQILEDIAVTRRNVLRGALKLWAVEPIVTSTAAGLGVSDPEKTALLADRVRGARRSEALTSIGLAALSIGLALSVPVAGALGASAGVVAALTVGDAEGAGKAAARANRATEELGVEGGKRYMRARDPGAELLLQGRGPGTFDLVYKMSKPPPDFVVVEAKGGGASASSSRRIGDLQVQQGRPEYAEDVLEAMASRGRIDEDIATAIQLALVRSRTEYVEVKQTVRRDGALGRLTARQFDLDLEN